MPSGRSGHRYRLATCRLTSSVLSWLHCPPYRPRRAIRPPVSPGHTFSFETSGTRDGCRDFKLPASPDRVNQTRGGIHPRPSSALGRAQELLRLGLKRFQLLGVLGREVLLSLAPLHGPVEAIPGLGGIAEMMIAHRQQEQVEAGLLSLVVL